MRLLLILLTLTAFTSTTAKAQFDPISLYGDRIEFDVVRDGEVVGEHITTFEQKAKELTVSSRMQLDIFLLIFPVYSFNYQSVETWKDGVLSGIKVDVLDGADDLKFAGKRDQDKLRLVMDNSAYALDVPIISTNHWNPAVVGETRVLNTLTGNLNNVIILDKGKESVQTTNGTLMAQRYDYEGDLKDTSVWYDKEGRWVKLQFKARDGSTIEYKCRTCSTKAGS